MTQKKRHIFEFSAPIRKSALPIIKSALTGALNSLGVDDDLSKAAAGELASCCESEVNLRKNQIQGNFECYTEKMDTVGKILIKAECGMDLNSLATLIAQSEVWNKFLKSSEFNKVSEQVEIQVYTEKR